MVIGFWNINRKNLSDSIVDFVQEKQVDILYLAEADDNTIFEFLKKVRKVIKNRSFKQLDSGLTKISLLTSYDKNIFSNNKKIYSSPRWLAHQLILPNRLSLNIISVHFHSKVNWSSASLALECTNLARDIALIEKKNNSENTILIGDFNMNPFEDGMVAANGLNAIQDLDYTEHRNNRKIDGISYKYFYNPMWNFFGDKKEPYGTHYCRVSGHISQEWNIYDQVLFRPSLKKFIERDGIEIVSELKDDKLTKAFGRPDEKKYSDHLPIVLKLKIKKI